MTVLVGKEQLVRNIVRLRRAEMLCPASEDIAAVRTDLERVAGPTVARAMAARLLGVSQTALDRWIARGDIPAVMTPAGRREVPLRALVELVEAVEARVERHPLASVLRQRRSDAERLDPRALLPARYRGSGDHHGHRGAELRALAYHRAVARRLDERIVRDALQRVRTWRSEGKLDPRYADEWEQVLSSPLPRIAKLIGSDSERARQLRQSSPFAGALSEPERRRALEAVGQPAP